LAKKLLFCTDILSFFPSIALLCNSKMPSSRYKTPDFRFNQKSLNHFNTKFLLNPCITTICYDRFQKNPVMTRSARSIVISIFSIVWCMSSSLASPSDESDDIKPVGYSQFLELLHVESKYKTAELINQLSINWTSEYEIMAIESLYFMNGERNSRPLVKLLQEKTGNTFGYDLDKWFDWLWNKKPTYGDEYFKFKAALHQFIDPKFKRYFLNRYDQATIRLDEVRWGGVLQDGIPPLRNPKMLAASDADYLRDGATVFGIEVNGDARAYPKQVLAWHEMFTDTVGGVSVAGVYCTLCGTVILYQTEHKGIDYQLGTSGFLYRSNKLMYDKKTQSLWSTLEGSPVIGPLVGKGIQLEYLSVVTTTWGEWKKRHPDTTVLSLKTGHKRDYREGVAYRDYFATDEPMFSVPKLDRRLNNKDEILAIQMPQVTKENMAISSRFLRRKSIYQNKLGDVNFTVFTDKSGAHRVFKTTEIQFVAYDGKKTAIDKTGAEWSLSENELKNPNGTILERLHSYNAFWFGYKAAYPEVVLIK